MMGSEHPVRGEPAAEPLDEEGGDPVCWAVADGSAVGMGRSRVGRGLGSHLAAAT
jgi:hypothetical protein